MHPLISYDVAKLMMDDRLRVADSDRRTHALRTPRRRGHPLRAAMGRGLIAFGARLASQRRTGAPAEQAPTMIMIRLNERP